MFTAALFTTKTRKQSKFPLTVKWIQKHMVHIHSGILIGHKKNKTVPFAETWMELETLILSEVSQKEKDKYHMTSLISGF